MDELPAAWIVGTTEQAIERLQTLATPGVDRIMLQHLLTTSTHSR